MVLYSLTFNAIKTQCGVESGHHSQGSFVPLGSDKRVLGNFEALLWSKLGSISLHRSDRAAAKRNQPATVQASGKTKHKLTELRRRSVRSNTRSALFATRWHKKGDRGSSPSNEDKQNNLERAGLTFALASGATFDLPIN